MTKKILTNVEIDGTLSVGGELVTPGATTLDDLTNVSSASAIAGDGLRLDDSGYTYSASTNYLIEADWITSYGIGWGSAQSLLLTGGGSARLDLDYGWVAWDFGVPKMISGFRRYGVHSSNYATTIRIQYSDDGDNWTLLEEFTGLTNANNVHRDLAVITESHRWWRYQMVSHAGAGDEMDAFQWAETTATPGGPPVWGPTSLVRETTDLDDVASGTPNNGDVMTWAVGGVYEPTADYITGATITSNGTGFGTTSTLDTVDSSSHRLDGIGNWVMWDFGVPERMCGIRRSFVHSLGHASSIRIEYSDDNSTWTELVTIDTSGTNGMTTSYNFADKSQEHRYWRYVLLALGGGSGDELDAFHFARTAVAAGTSKWTPAAIPSQSVALDDLTDVDTSTVAPTTDQALVWDGSNWVPGDMAAGGIATWDAGTQYLNGDVVYSNGTIWTASGSPPTGVQPYSIDPAGYNTDPATQNNEDLTNPKWVLVNDGELATYTYPSFQNAGASNLEPQYGGFQTTDTVWYAFTANQACTLSIDTQRSTGSSSIRDTYFYLYTAATPTPLAGDLTQLTTVDVGGTFVNNGDPAVLCYWNDINLTAGTLYFLQVGNAQDRDCNLIIDFRVVGGNLLLPGESWITSLREDGAFRGVWDVVTAYTNGDTVTHNGSTWGAETTPSVGDEPGVATAWAVISPNINDYVPDPSGESDGRLLGVTSGALAYQDAPSSVSTISDLTDVDTSTVAPTTDQALVWNGSNWVPGDVAGTPTALATGGSEIDYAGYKVHKFTSDGDFTVLSGSLTVEYLSVSGGGGGGNGAAAGGGGGGGVVTGSQIISSGTYSVTVGAGGAAHTSGGSSSITGIAGSVVSGGGGGASEASAALSGATGGGGARGANTGAVGTVGFDGGDGTNTTGGGGGGMSEAGADSIYDTGNGYGGEGISYDWDGTATVYGSGGGGGNFWSDKVAAHGGTNAGDGGMGSTLSTAGIDGTGGGGGGGGNGASIAGSAGGSGVVMIRYVAPTDISSSAFTSKGSLLTGTGTGTYTARAVGADGTTLVADSSEADGVKWQAVTPVIVLGPADPVPGGTAAGTVIVRTA